MKAVLYIDLTTENPLHFDNPFLKEIKRVHPAIETLDLDAASDNSLFAYSERMIQESEKAVVVFLVSENSSYKKIQAIADTLILQKNKVLVWLNGTNQLIQKLLSPVGSNFCITYTSEELLSKTQSFLQTGGKS